MEAAMIEGRAVKALRSSSMIKECLPARALCPRLHMQIHTDLPPGSGCHAVLLRPKQTRLPTMSTIELVDPELRDALAQWPQVR